MDFDSLFIVIFIAVAVMLLLTVAIPMLAYKRWRRKGLVWGCLSLPVIGIILLFVTIGIYATLTDISHKNAMAYVRYVEEERDCRFEEPKSSTRRVTRTRRRPPRRSPIRSSARPRGSATTRTGAA